MIRETLDDSNDDNRRIRRIKITSDGVVDENHINRLTRCARPFEAVLMVMDQPKRKKFVRLEFKNRLYWADTVTGILYDEQSGKSKSVHLWIKPGQTIKLPAPIEGDDE